MVDLSDATPKFSRRLRSLQPGWVLAFILLVSVALVSVIGGTSDAAEPLVFFSVSPSPLPTPTPVPPRVNDVTPNEGRNDQSTNITITGRNFVATPSVALGTHVLTNVSWLDSTRLIAVVPPGLAPGVYDLFVTNPNGQVGILANAFRVRVVQPTIVDIRPNQGRNDLPNEINIYGFNFVAGAVARLDSLPPLTTTYINSTQLRARVEAGIAPGTYDVTVTNPDSNSAHKARAYTAIEITTNDDLYGYDYGLWTNPSSLRAQEPGQVGLIVHRQGGKQSLSNVKVRFYAGNPNAGGALLGDGTIVLLSPRSSASTSGVAWTPATAGAYSIYAVIDPDNAVNETIETNNVVSRTLTVLPPSLDSVPPRVDSFTIDDGAENTTVLTVTLDTTASDPPPSSGLASLLYQEFEYNQGAGQWVPVRNSGWVDYESSRVDFPWTLLPSAGVKYLQAWVADNAGNISLFPYRAFISYIPPTDSVGQDQVRVYRYTLNVGDQLTARVEPVSGDPDLYVWPPDYQTRPPWVSNQSGSAVEEVSFPAPVAGVYQVEVYGYTAAEYRLSVTIAPAGQSARATRTQTNLDQDKPERTQPVVAPESEPDNQQGLPTAPTTTMDYIYLPMATKNYVDPWGGKLLLFVPFVQR